MTDELQPTGIFIRLRRTAIVLLLAAVVGSLLGFVAAQFAATRSQAVAIISIGRKDQAAFIEEPFAVIERVKSTAFAAAVAARAGVPELSTRLPARQYGGDGAIEARGLREQGLLEIKVNDARAEVAQKAVSAVIEQLIADHRAKTEQLDENLKSSLPALADTVSEMTKDRDTIAKRLGNILQKGEADQDSAALLSALALTNTGLSSAIRNTTDLTIFSYNLRKTQIVAAPAVAGMKATSFYQVIAAGALAGIVIALLLLQLIPDLFQKKPLKPT